jgi:diguanylate cyclase (GGDEF)-like protein/PAS domain S-box-containing protein
MAISEKQDNSPHSPATGADRMRADTVHASLRALEALLSLEGDAASFANLCQRLRHVFRPDHTMVIAEDADALVCIAAAPSGPIGARWPCEPFFTDVLRGRVRSVAGSRGSDARQPFSADLIPAGASALCLPAGVRGRRAVLLLRRDAGKADFDEAEVAFARQCAVVALAAIAAHHGKDLASETERWRRQVEDLQRSAHEAEHDRTFLKDIVDALSIGLTVQDEGGRFVLVNKLAAANLETPAAALIGASPADFLSEEEAAQRRQWEVDLLRSGETVTVEENAPSTTDERTWLTSHTPATIAGRTLLISAALDITSRKQVEQKLARHAFFDDLTGLPNRFLINERVDQALRRDDHGNRFALAFIDLDNFKHINDYYSHVVGDALLVKVTERIRKALRDTDMLARISGDEFLLLIDPLAGEEQARTIVNALLDELKQPFHIEAFEVFTSASIGVSIYPEHGATYEVLRRNADSAMYRAKNERKGEAVYFDSGIGERITAHMELEQRLRLAIRDRKFCCAFQPKVDLHTQEVVGFETLVRWRDEAEEIHAPGSFIGLATELGLIDPITHFVLAESIGSIERLDQAFGGGTTISINVAAKQAGNMTFMSSLAEVLKDSPYAERFMLELTEDAFVAKSQFQNQVLPMLRELGVRVSIDDFGTGYSSLAVLADITADEIKVDRSFITAIHQRPRSQSVLRTIESLGLALGMTVVAEGIETFEELAYLQATSRIRYAQGFYFSKPFFLDEIKDARELLASGRSAEATRTNVQWRNPLASRRADGPQFGRG